MKKIYLKPEVELIEENMSECLLAGSIDNVLFDMGDETIDANGGTDDNNPNDFLDAW